MFPPPGGAARNSVATVSDYDVEAVDRLPFSTDAKAGRYRTEDFTGAVGLNWYTTDPTLRATMAYYCSPTNSPSPNRI